MADDVIGYVVVELLTGETKPENESTLFRWDGGELWNTSDAAECEAEQARKVDPRYDYKVAMLTLVTL